MVPFATDNQTIYRTLANDWHIYLNYAETDFKHNVRLTYTYILNAQKTSASMKASKKFVYFLIEILRFGEMRNCENLK